MIRQELAPFNATVTRRSKSLLSLLLYKSNRLTAIRWAKVKTFL
jgi:hypothetical protein